MDSGVQNIGLIVPSFKGTFLVAATWLSVFNIKEMGTMISFAGGLLVTGLAIVHYWMEIREKLEARKERKANKTKNDAGKA